MSFYRCGRCNWRPEDGETLEQHAEAAEHPLCVACTKSLPPDRPRVCRDCRDANAVRLDEVLAMWGELPSLLAMHASAPLPGGDALVLAGPGSRGVQGSDDRDVRLEADDNAMADVPSVAWTLLSWADDWRHVRDQVDVDREHADGSAAVVLDSHAYLVEHADWAAAEHWAWQEYAADISHVHAALRWVTGRHRPATRLGVLCLACRGQLVYRIVSDDQDERPSRPRWWVDRETSGPVTAAEYFRRHLGRAGLEEDDATCRDCGLRYTPAALMNAHKQAVADAQWLTDEEGVWGKVRALAEQVERSHWSLRTWWRQGLVRGRHEDGDLYLHLGDVASESASRPPRRARQARSA